MNGVTDPQHPQANELPDLRAWARDQATNGRPPAEVAESLSTHWGVGPIPLRKLLMEAFQVGLGEANEVCGSIHRYDSDHPLAQAANLQLQRGWLRDITTPGTQVKITLEQHGGWVLSMTRRGQTIGTSLATDNDSSDSARRSAEQLIATWVPGADVAWHPTGTTHPITGAIVGHAAT
jgi:hypothetical protein